MAQRLFIPKPNEIFDTRDEWKKREPYGNERDDKNYRHLVQIFAVSVSGFLQGEARSKPINRLIVSF